MALHIVPLVLGVSSTVAGATGIATAMVGVGEIRTARAQVVSDNDRLGKRREAHRAKVEHTSAVLQDFGRTQELAQHDVIIRFEDFLVSNGKQVRVKKHFLLDGIDESNTQASGLAKLDSDVIG